MTGLSPLYRDSASRLMSDITLEAKTFNIHSGFGRRLWKYQTTTFADVPKGAFVETGLSNHRTKQPHELGTICFP